MIFKIFATIVAFIMSLLGLHQQTPQPKPSQPATTTVSPSVSVKPAQPTSTPNPTPSTTSTTTTTTEVTSPASTSTPIPPRPPLMMLSDLPAGLHRATDAEMRKLTTHRWVSTSPLIFRVHGYAEIDFTKNPNTSGNHRGFSGGTKCCTVQGTVVVKQSTISISSWGDSTKTTCDPQVLAVEDAEFREFLNQSTVYFNADGSSAYLKRGSDGAVNEWKLADN